jgi:hypothetical protein
MKTNVLRLIVVAACAGPVLALAQQAPHHPRIMQTMRSRHRLITAMQRVTADRPMADSKPDPDII